MRIARGLKRLRRSLVRRGITSTTSAFSGAFASCAVAALPAELAARTARAALSLPALSPSILTTTATMTAKAKITCAATGMLLACAVGLPLGLVREHSLRGRLAEMQQQLDAQAEAMASLRAKSGAGIAVAGPAPSGSGTASAAGSGQADPIAAAQKALDPKNPGRDLLLKAAGGLMKIPGMKKILADQARPIMESRYADLLDDHWQLGPEVRTRAMEIICGAVAEQAAVALDHLDGGVTAEERKEIEASAKQADEARDAQLAALLDDPEKMEEFRIHERSEGERVRLQALRDRLTADGAPLLSEVEERQLMDLLYAERQAANATAPLDDPQVDVPSAAGSGDFSARRTAMDARIVEEAAAFLNAAQTTALAATLTATRESESAAVRLANGIMGVPAEDVEER